MTRSGSSPKRRFLHASAGTGKTYRLVEAVADAVRTKGVRAEGIVATTFTSASARELEERLLGRFFSSGMAEEAGRLEDAWIGTVHSLCFRLLSRFAFEAGISPELRILEDREADLLLDRALEETVSEQEKQRFFSWEDRLGQRSYQTGHYYWRLRVREIIGAARTNGIDFADLPSMGEASWEEMRLAYPAPEEGLEEQLRAELGVALQALPLGAEAKTKKTKAYREAVETLLRKLSAGSLRWSEWMEVVRNEPEKKLQGEVSKLVEVAKRVAAHPEMQREVKEYVQALFTTASQVGSRFQEGKAAAGTADFVDLERETLAFLEREEGVREILREELDLLVVDEFQDTSPLQLSLFEAIGECVDEVIWVGDVKQSIYGFRDADPALIFRAVSSVTEGETLGTNWRSAPDLVALQNALFAQPFAERLGLSAEKVVVAPHRQAATKDPAVSVLTLESGVPLKYGGMKRLKNEERAETMADAVAAFLAEKPEVVDPGSVTADDPEGQVRPVQVGDVAVLVRTNAVGNAIATALRSRGLEVVVTGPGLVATPECQLALAALRVLADPRDSLAAAEVIALEQEVEREQWLTDRLEFRVAEIAEGGEKKEWGGNLSSSLRALRAGREEARSLSPRQQLEMAVRWGGVRETVAKWGPNPARSEQRLSNVEGVLQLIAEYEEGHGGLGIPLSLKGMFAWLEDRVEEGADFRPGRRQVEAIQVRTYHGSKGLEWPVVFCADLDGASRSGLFGMRVVGDEHGERGVRFWVNPFGTERGVDVVDRLRASDIGQAILSREGEEALRLLYVGLSRARDRMVLFRDEPARSGWWDELGVPMDSLGNLGIPVRTGTQTWGSGSGEETGSEGGDVMIPRRRETRTKRLGAEAPPSSAEAVEGAAMGEVLRYGGRLSWKGNPSDRDFGDALHRVLAVELGGRGATGKREEEKIRVERAKEIFLGFGLEGVIDAKAILGQVDRYAAAVATYFGEGKVEVEVPFERRNAQGQKVKGFIDHLVHTGSGPVVLDHKFFPGKQKEWERVALSYSGQLAAYREALGGQARTFLHFVTQGVLVEVRFGVE